MSRLKEFLTSIPQSSPGMTSEEASMVREIQAHDLAEAKRLRRIQLAAEWAKNQDIPLEVLAAFDRPFPGNNFNVTTHKSGMGTLGKLAIGAALATGIGGLGLGALSLLDPAKEIEKIIPGVDHDVIVTPGETIVE